MKKLFTILLCLLMLCACKQDNGTMEIDPGEEPIEITGGWCSNPDLPAINDAYFDKANTDGLYTPIALLGSQVVAGVNYKYLAYGPTTSYDADSSYKIVTVYVDLQDNAEITNVSDFILSDYLQANDNTTPDGLMGGYTDNTELVDMCGNDLSTVFGYAVKDLVGVDYTPICLLASQVVAGTNYAFLAKGTVVTAEPTTHLYIFNIYESLDGTATINNISGLNVANLE